MLQAPWGPVSILLRACRPELPVAVAAVPAAVNYRNGKRIITLSQLAEPAKVDEEGGDFFCPSESSQLAMGYFYSKFFARRGYLHFS